MTVAAATSFPRKPGLVLRLSAPAAAGIAVGAGLLLVDWRVVVLGFVAFGLIAMTLRHPFAGVVVYLLIALVRPEELGFSPIVFRLQLLFAIVCLLSLAVPGLLRGQWRPWNWLGTDRAVVWLSIAVAASVPLSVSRPTALVSCWEFSKLVFAYVLIRQTVTTPARLRAIVWLIVGATAATAALAQHGWWTGRVYVGELGTVRIAGLTSAAGDPNSLANTLVASLPLVVLLAAAEPSLLHKLLLAVCAGGTLYVTALTGARASIISLGVVVLLLVLVARRRTLALILMGTLLLLLWTRLPAGLMHRYLTIRDYRTEATYRTRVQAARVGVQMLRDHPVTGVGLGCFQIARVEAYDRVWLQPHNVYAQVASEMGLLGLAAFGALVYGLMRTCRTARRLVPHTQLAPADRRRLERICLAIMITLLALLIQGLAGHNFRRWHYYLGAAVATSCLQIASSAMPSRRPIPGLPDGAGHR